MSRKNITGSRTKVLEIPRFNGLNTASSFSEIDITQSPRMLNFLPNSLGGLANRPGTRTVSDSSISSIGVITNLRKDKVNNILATSGTKLYKFADGTFIEQPGTINRADVDSAQFKDANGKEVLVIADGANLKQYDGSKVTEITPAANDESPLPANDLATINSKHKPTGCLVHNTRVVLWNNTDTIWHSKIGYHDYYPKTDYQRFVRENDYVQTCVSYRGALIVFMRRHIAVLFGHDIENWSQDFLDTNEGCLAPKTVQIVTFPDGKQEVFYVSDDGVHSLYTIDTLNLDSSARYSTKSMTSKAINWKALGVKKSEWQNAVAHFHEGRYWLIYQKGTEYKGLVFDTRTNGWYPVDSIHATSFYHDEDFLYFGSTDGHFRVLDPELVDDSGKPFTKEWYSKMISPKLTGFDHFWDILMVEAKQFEEQSSLDVEVNTQRNQFSSPTGLITSVFVWGKTKWGEAEWANKNLTDHVNNAKRLRTFLKGRYAQIKLSNDRNEPIEIYGIWYEVRTMDTYY